MSDVISITRPPTIKNVLQAIFSSCDGLLNFRAHGVEYTTSSHYQLDDTIGIKAFVNDHVLIHDVYVSMATYRDDSNATGANALHLPALFVDLDFGDDEEAARTRLTNFLYPPSIVWNSGGGLHCVWLLKEPFDLRNPAEVAQAGALLRRLAACLGADPAAAEPNRVLRVVKTFNHKPAFTPAKRVEVEVFEPSRTYHPSDFDELLPAESAETMPGAAVTIPEKVQRSSRNKLLFRQGRSLKRQGLIPGAIQAALSTTNLMCCEPPLAEQEVAKIFTSVVKQKDRKGFEPVGTPLLASEPSVQMVAVPPVDVPDLALLLDTTAQYFRRFVVMSDHQASTLALWTAHTYVYLAVDITPYLHVTACTKRAGKSLLLRGCLANVVASPWKTSRVSPAALLRKVDKMRPTLLLDEVDQAMRSPGEYKETLTALLNAGFEKDGTASLCQGDHHEVVDFHVYCPKALCGIGKLPDTVADRSITISLRRRKRSESIARGRERSLRAAGLPLQRQWSVWGAANLHRLQGVEPALPEVLDDRQQDCWEPLLAVADLAGPEWGIRARAAAVALSGLREDPDLAVQLLKDIRGEMDAVAVKDPRGAPSDVIPTVALLSRLNKLAESPWPTFSRGGEMTAHALGSMLRGFELHSRKHRIGEVTKRGYLWHEFQDAFSRYVGSEAEQAEQTNETGGIPTEDEAEQAALVPLRGSEKSPTFTGVVPPVPLQPPYSGGLWLHPPVPLETLISALRAGSEKNNGHRLSNANPDTPPPFIPSSTCNNPQESE